MGGLSAESRQIKKIDRNYTLPEWICKIYEKRKHFRHNRMRSNLRVTTILKTSLLTAESILKVRQSQRVMRWSEIQREEQMKLKTINDEEALQQNYYFNDNYSSTINKKNADEEKIKDMWKSTELSGLNKFFNDLSNFKISARSN